VTAVLIGLLASAAGLRRAVNIDPALAFGGQ
jgi:putative ABC transport system permease protein